MLQLTPGKVELLPACHVPILKYVLSLVFLTGQLFPLVYPLLFILHVFVDEFFV